MSEEIPIHRYTFEQLLDSYYQFYTDFYHRAVVTKQDFLRDTILEDVTLAPDLFQWVKDWQAKP